jgi:hypothetical protein
MFSTLCGENLVRYSQSSDLNAQCYGHLEAPMSYISQLADVSARWDPNGIYRVEACRRLCNYVNRVSSNHVIHTNYFQVNPHTIHRTAKCLWVEYHKQVADRCF